MVSVYEYKNNIYVSLTNRCTNNCVFCDKKLLQEKVESVLELEKEPSAKQVLSELENLNPRGEVVFCGIGEPILRLNTVLEVCRYARKKGLRTRLDTNGQAFIIHPERNVALELREAGLDSVSISLNALDREEYNKKCRPSFYMKGKYNVQKQVLNFAKACKKNRIKTTLTFVDYNLDREACHKLARKLKVKSRIRPLVE